MNPSISEMEYGLRSTYSLLPTSQEQLEQFSIPLSIHCTPLKFQTPNEQAIIRDQLVTCSCGAFFNIFSQINYNTNTYHCTFCQHQTKLPQYVLNYFQNQDTPPQMTHQVIEYSLGTQQTKNYFIFVLDTQQSLNNLQGLKNSLSSLVEILDFDKMKICIIAFNKIIQIFRKTNGDVIHSILFDLVNLSQDRQRMLGLKVKNGKFENSNQIEQNFFIDNPKDFLSIIDTLENEFQNTPQDERPQRATGKALELAIDIITYSCLPASRIILFTSGPCTTGDGRVANIKMEEFIRKQVDLEENQEIKQRCENATKFYDDLGVRMRNLNSSLDIFAYSLDQFGLFEMRNLVRKCGSIIILNEEFHQEHFKLNLLRIFQQNQDGNIDLHQGASIQLKCQNQLKICGVIGNLCSTKKKIKNQGDNKIGEHNSDEWFIGGIDSQSTFLFFFELCSKNKNKPEPNGTTTNIQFILRYQHSSGENRLRILTLEKQFYYDNSPIAFLNYIDQFNVISTYSKIAAYRTIEQESFFVRRYLDKKLISILKAFKNNGIPEELNLIPQYFYYLRKSQFVSKMASSLDEIIYYRHHNLWQIPEHILIMIQPQIIEYSLNHEEPLPVMPDMDCLKKDVVLLADTYFQITIWRGQHIQSWYEQEYHKQPEYEYFDNFLKQSDEDYQLIIEDRLIVPEKIEAWYGSPSERLLKSKLNPEVKQQTNQHDSITDGNFVTEDASLSVFMQKLITLINQKDSQFQFYEQILKNYLIINFFFQNNQWKRNQIKHQKIHYLQIQIHFVRNKKFYILLCSLHKDLNYDHIHLNFEILVLENVNQVYNL